jgi:hypothetical protein
VSNFEYETTDPSGLVLVDYSWCSILPLEFSTVTSVSFLPSVVKVCLDTGPKITSVVTCVSGTYGSVWCPPCLVLYDSTEWVVIFPLLSST